jgi:hypothetical protein
MLGSIAALGWVLSAVLHLALRLHLVSHRWWMSVLLAGGLAIVWLPAIISSNRQQRGTAGRGVWLGVAFSFLYALANMRLLPDPIEERSPVALSGTLIAFYGVATALLWPAKRPAVRSRISS